MLYLENFTFPTEDQEWRFFINQELKVYNSYYPFQTIVNKGVQTINFEPITILSGSNGSGKTTILNVISEKLKLSRETPYNRTNFYEEYLEMSDFNLSHEITPSSCIITSDDVFDYMLNIREVNEGIDKRKSEVYEEYLDAKHANFHYHGPEDYNKLKEITTARRQTQSKFTREHVMDNIREQSNGESAFNYFTKLVKDDGLYILDEPENSLSPKLQIELVRFIEDSARFYNCQFIIATHSPFLLSIKYAKIFDMDSSPVTTKKWTELDNVKIYHDFFDKHNKEF
ncbi:AAA family ATPase [Companilactobacillus metriopterae]|uniref:AAA family ATPase n=1 Tax=Companilactobacillus metriopterae TaxID=1909267 RepID=UPI00100AA92A|nr:AAA family ATPase [Companilactobacillus metriopterae]